MATVQWLGSREVEEKLNKSFKEVQFYNGDLALHCGDSGLPRRRMRDQKRCRGATQARQTPSTYLLFYWTRELKPTKFVKFIKSKRFESNWMTVWRKKEIGRQFSNDYLVTKLIFSLRQTGVCTSKIGYIQDRGSTHFLINQPWERKTF